VVELLFHSEGSVAPVRAYFARLLAPSFGAYFEQLPPGLRAKCTEICKALADDPLAALEVWSPVVELGPYHALADSLRRRLPDVPGGVVRALVLSLSPASEDSRAWLRGEADQIPYDRLQALQLGEESPPPADVVRGAAAFLRLLNVPLVLCFDQLELLFQGSRDGFRDLAAQLMGWLGTVPNLVVVLGCVDAGWRAIADAGFASFADRVAAYDLTPLAPEEAVALVTSRLKAWEDFDPARGEGWPFELGSVRALARSRPTPPRGFIQTCRAAFDQWAAEGRKGLISLGGQAAEAPLPELFVKEWGDELSATRARLKSPADYSDDELWEGIDEALKVAQKGRHGPPGVCLDRAVPQALAKSPTDRRRSAELQLGVGEERVSVVVAVSKKDGGAAFGSWYAALEQALGGHVAGAVVVWPKAQLSVGKTAAAYKKYKARVDAGEVRPFPLDVNTDTLAQLECLRAVVRRSREKGLVLGGRTVSEEECRRLLAETGLIASLPLFRFLFENWPAVEKVRARTATSTEAADTSAVGRVKETAHKAAVGGGGPAVAERTVREAKSADPKPKDSSGAEAILAKVIEKLTAKGQAVQPAGVEVGPTFIRVKVELRDDADFAKVKRQADNLKLHLGLEAKPLIASQAGYVSIDVQRKDRQSVPLASLLSDRPADLAGQPAFPVGVDVGGCTAWLNLADSAHCHLLVAGTTGSGKSEFLKAMIAGLAAHLDPDQLKFLLIDPKQVTFNFPKPSPYSGGPVVYEAAEAIPVVRNCFQEMERRYGLLRAKGKEHVGELTGADAVPRWVLVFDEFADLMADRACRKELETLLQRLGAKARAAGIHLVLGTQRPEASVVTPLLRSNLPGRVGLRVASERDSKLLLDEPDAAYLFGRGDLFWRRGGELLRLQSPYVGRAELERGLRAV
jgi:hypothetical protein